MTRLVEEGGVQEGEIWISVYACLCAPSLTLLQLRVTARTINTLRIIDVLHVVTASFVVVIVDCKIVLASFALPVAPPIAVPTAFSAASPSKPPAIPTTTVTTITPITTITIIIVVLITNLSGVASLVVVV